VSHCWLGTHHFHFVFRIRFPLNDYVFRRLAIDSDGHFCIFEVFGAGVDSHSSRCRNSSQTVFCKVCPLSQSIFESGSGTAQIASLLKLCNIQRDLSHFQKRRRKCHLAPYKFGFLCVLTCAMYEIHGKWVVRSQV
jgi:hypothetical protein